MAAITKVLRDRGDLIVGWSSGAALSGAGAQIGYSMNSTLLGAVCAFGGAIIGAYGFRELAARYLRPGRGWSSLLRSE